MEVPAFLFGRIVQALPGSSVSFWAEMHKMLPAHKTTSVFFWLLWGNVIFPSAWEFSFEITLCFSIFTFILCGLNRYEYLYYPGLVADRNTVKLLSLFDYRDSVIELSFWLPPHVLMGNVAKWFSLCLIRPEDLFFVVWKSFRCLLGNSQQTVNCLLVRKGFRMAISTIKRGVEEYCTLAHSISKKRNVLQTSSIWESLKEYPVFWGLQFETLQHLFFS